MLRAGLTAAGSANQITSAKAHSAIRTLRVCTVGAVLACIVSGASQPAMAQPAKVQGVADLPAFAPGMINHMQAMRRFKDRDHGVQPTPNVIPKFEIDQDASGAIATFQPNGQTFTANNAFFQILGPTGGPVSPATNQRTAGVSARPVLLTGLRRVLAQIPFSVWWMAPHVRPPMSQPLRRSGKPISSLPTKA